LTFCRPPGFEQTQNDTPEVSLDPLKWGLIPYWCKDPKGGRKPINAKAETVSRLPMFRDAYTRRRCILPVDGFFEWKAIKGQKAKQPFAIAMRDGSPDEIDCQSRRQNEASACSGLVRYASEASMTSVAQLRSVDQSQSRRRNPETRQHRHGAGRLRP
jgi:SOS response associated peptidase (SRAP)